MFGFLTCVTHLQVMTYCLEFVPGKPVWIVDVWDYIVEKIFRVAIDLSLGLDAVSVNCTGAQMPPTMITNIVILMFIG